MEKAHLWASRCWVAYQGTAVVIADSWAEKRMASVLVVDAPALSGKLAGSEQEGAREFELEPRRRCTIRA